MYILYRVPNNKLFQAEDGDSIALDSGIVVHIPRADYEAAGVYDYIEATFSTALGEHTIRAKKESFDLLYGVG